MSIVDFKSNTLMAIGCLFDSAIANLDGNLDGNNIMEQYVKYRSDLGIFINRIDNETREVDRQFKSNLRPLFSKARSSQHTSHEYDRLSIKEYILNTRKLFVDAIALVPNNLHSVVMPGWSTYSTYLYLRKVIGLARYQVVITDRFIDHTIFHRYLSELNESVDLTLVTGPLHMTANRKKRAEFIDVSKLYAKQYSKNYKLVICDNFHDRWVCCDSQFFSLGPSIKDAGLSPTTISIIDDMQSNLNELLKITNGEQLFGDRQPTHLE